MKASHRRVVQEPPHLQPTCTPQKPRCIPNNQHARPKANRHTPTLTCTARHSTQSQHMALYKPARPQVNMRAEHVMLLLERSPSSPLKIHRCDNLGAAPPQAPASSMAYMLTSCVCTCQCILKNCQVKLSLWVSNHVEQQNANRNGTWKQIL